MKSRTNGRRGKVKGEMGNEMAKRGYFAKN